MPNFALEFYRDEQGREPAREWMRSLNKTQREAVGYALHNILGQQGIGVCGTEYGKQLGQGLFEFRLRHTAAEVGNSLGQPVRPDATADRVLLRIFCHAQGNSVIVIFGGYDKSKDPTERRQQRELATNRSRLSAFRAGSGKSVMER